MQNRKTEISWRLCLAGGGAKGAYQFGVILGLHQKKVTFEKIAGTSVGALNGALLSADALKAGELFWRNLKYSDVYPPRNSFMRALSPRIYNIFVFSLLVVNLLLVPLGRADPMYGTQRVFDLVRFAWIIVGTALFVFLAVSVTPSDQLRWPMLLAIPFVSIVLAAVLFHTPDKGAGCTRLGVVLISLVLCGLLYRPLFTISVLAMVVVTVRALALLRQVALLDSTVLASRASEILEDRIFTLPLVVTLAKHCSLFDPKAGYYRALPMMIAGADMSGVEATYKPTVRPMWVPIYAEVEGSANGELNLARLIASASLPFGIVKSVQIDDEKFVDGGVCNNFPLVPLAGPGSRVLVIHMEEKPLGEERLKLEADDCLRKTRLAALPIPDDVRSVGTPRVPSEYQNAIKSTTKIETLLEVYPKKSIRTKFPLFDLLRFEKSYTNRLIEIGIEDGEQAARQLEEIENRIKEVESRLKQANTMMQRLPHHIQLGIMLMSMFRRPR